MIVFLAEVVFVFFLGSIDRSMCLIVKKASLGHPRCNSIHAGYKLPPERVIGLVHNYT